MKSARNALKFELSVPKKTARRWSTRMPKRKRRRTLPRTRLRARPRRATRKRKNSSTRFPAKRGLETAKRTFVRNALFVCLKLELLPDGAAYRADESCLVIQHRKTKFLAPGRDLDVNRYQHAVIEDLLIGGGIEGLVHLDALSRQTFLAGAPDGGVEVHVHLLVAGRVFCRQGVSIDLENYPHLAWIGGFRLRHKRNLGRRNIDCESGGHILLVVVVLCRTRLNRKVPLAVADLGIALVDFHFDVAHFPIPLLVLGVVTQGVRGFFVIGGEGDALLNFVLIDIGFAPGLCRHFFHCALTGLQARNLNDRPVGDCGIAVDRTAMHSRTLHSAN